LGYIVVNESHCENKWISGEKSNYHALGTLRNTYNHIPWVVTTTKTSVEVNIKKKRYILIILMKLCVLFYY